MTSCRRCRGGWSSWFTRSFGSGHRAITRWRRSRWSRAFALVWLTARPLVGPVGALVAVLILDGLHYFHFTAAKFNHDVIQLPFWALAGYAFHAALRHGRVSHWMLLGFAIGLALWAKYFVVVLAVPLALFLLFDRDARKALTTPGPWIALAVALVVMAPHLLWLVRNDFLPFAYAERALGAVARLARSCRASGGLRGRPGRLSAAVAADRRGACVAAAQSRRSSGGGRRRQSR